MNDNVRDLFIPDDSTVKSSAKISVKDMHMDSHASSMPVLNDSMNATNKTISNDKQN